MSEDMIVRNCSPTLAGLKTGSLFSCGFDSDTELTAAIRRWNGILVKKGLRMLPLRCRDHRALIYVFRPSSLSRDLCHSTAIDILAERGYPSGSQEKCIMQLMRRLGDGEDFPHEIGLFLGYPPEDVSGFIEKGSKACKCVGTWKVYGDVEAAQKRFAAYKACTACYCDALSRGCPVEALTVKS